MALGHAQAMGWALPGQEVVQIRGPQCSGQEAFLSLQGTKDAREDQILNTLAFVLRVWFFVQRLE